MEGLSKDTKTNNSNPPLNALRSTRSQNLAGKAPAGGRSSIIERLAQLPSIGSYWHFWAVAIPRHQDVSDEDIAQLRLPGAARNIVGNHVCVNASGDGYSQVLQSHDSRP